jgi:hypothetical protein
MISLDKLPGALYSLHGVLVMARQMAYTGSPGAAIADILDTAEMLPRLIACETNETDQFRRYLDHIAEKYKRAFVLQYFDEPAPPNW